MKIIIILLLALVLINVFWTVLSSRFGPVIGAVIYFMVGLIFKKQKVWHPVIAVGVVGFVLHGVELFSAISSNPVWIDTIFLALNILLPLLLVLFGIKEILDRRHHKVGN
jgi:drug/metabolite transporter (DMT)-like permease